MKQYIVYITQYKGNKLPPFYIGSSNIEKITNGYNGSVTSKKYREIYNKEQKENKHLFKTRILSYHETRKEALEEELRLQKKHFVVKNKRYFNESYAQPNGYFGRDAKGKLNVMYGKTHTPEVRRVISKNMLNTVIVRNKITNEKIKVSRKEWKNNPDLEAESKGRKIKDTSNYGKRDQRGKANNAAITIEIYDNNNKLIYVCEGGFEKFCIDNGLPSSMFRTSYKQNRIIGDTKDSITRLKNKGLEMYLGWKAVKKGRTFLIKDNK